METIDRAAEWRRLKELYSGMSDDQLADIAAEGYQLTELAQQALETEIKTRRLDLRLAAPPPEPEEEQEEQLATPEDVDPSTLDLAVFIHAENREEAVEYKRILDAIGCYSWVGDENATSIHAYQGSFESGVDIKVERDILDVISEQFGRYRRSHPKDKDQGDDSEIDFTPATCPKCHSEDIVFRSLDPKLKGDAAVDAKYRWHCEACGHKWEDDGVIA